MFVMALLVAIIKTEQRALPDQGRTQKFPLEGATRGWGLGRGFSSPSGEGSGEGLCPSPEKFSFLTMEMVHSDALFDTFRHCL